MVSLPIVVYDFREFTAILTGTEADQIIGSNSRRLAIEISARGTTQVLIGVSPNVSATWGVYLDYTKSALVYLYKDWGPLAQVPFYAWLLAGDPRVMVKEMFIAGYSG